VATFQYDKRRLREDRGRPHQLRLVPLDGSTVAALSGVALKGAQAREGLFRLAEATKANGLNPFAHCSHLFPFLPMAASDQDLRTLLPTQIATTAELTS